MSLQKYYVIEELYKLSQKSNEIIDNFYSETALNNDYFDGIKREVSEILNNKKKKKKFKNNLVNRQRKVDNYLEPFFETRVTIHKRQRSKMANETSFSSPLDLRKKTFDVTSFKMSPDCLSNQSVPVDSRNYKTEQVIERNSCNKSFQHQKENSQRYSKSNSACNPSWALTCWNNKSGNSQEGSMQFSPNFNKSKPSEVDEKVKICPSGDNLFGSTDISLTKRKSRTILKCNKTIELHCDESIENSDRSSINSINISGKSFVASSGSSAVKNGRSISANSTSVSSCDSSVPNFKSKKAIKLYADESIENFDPSPANSMKISNKTYTVSSGSSAEKDGSTASISTIFVTPCDSSVPDLKSKKEIKSYFDELVENSDRLSGNSINILDKTYTVSSDSSTEKKSHSTLLSSCNSSAFLFNINEHNEQENEIKTLKTRNKRSIKDCSRSPLIIENLRDKTIHKRNQASLRARKSYEFKEKLVGLKEQILSQHENKSLPIYSASIEEGRKLLDSKPVRRYRLRSHEKKYIDEHEPLTDIGDSRCIKSNVSPTVQGNTNFRKLPVPSKIIENVKGESCSNKKKALIDRKTNTRNEKIFISDVGGRKYKRNSVREKNCLIQLHSFSAPVKKKKNINRNRRPITPIVFLDSNRDSLKEKTEEKRREREVRMQKTKERRERLDLEKKEKIRKNQQRLEQRFQQHEEMLKQKREKLKIKSRNRQKRYTKKSDASTSSKDSKDRTKDNDDFCRNSINSGQKLSKESNGYRDVSLEKESLTSLEGDVGQNPEISKKQNAIPVGCEKTPVELLVSCDGMNLNKFEKVPEVENEIRLKDSKSCGSNTDITLGLKTSCSDKALKKVKCAKGLNLRRNAKHTGFKRKNCNILTSKQMQNTSDCKKVESSYLLTSTEKHNKRKDIPDVLSLNIESRKHHTSNYEKQNHNNITSSSETLGTSCSKFCFKMSTKRAKKKGKVPLFRQIYASNDSSVQPKKDKCILQESKNCERVESREKNSIKPQEEIKSYKIPDSADESSEENKVDIENIPRWAKGIYLKQAIIQQYHYPPNLEDIFGLLPIQPVELTEVFDKDKPEYHRRTSSENWSLNMTPQ